MPLIRPSACKNFLRIWPQNSAKSSMRLMVFVGLGLNAEKRIGTQRRKKQPKRNPEPVLMRTMKNNQSAPRDLLMKTIYIAVGREVSGPFNDQEIKEGLKCAKWSGKDLAWKPGLKKWMSLNHFQRWVALNQLEMNRTTVGATFVNEPPPVPSLLERQNKMILFTAMAAMVLILVWFAGFRGKPTAIASSPETSGAFGKLTGSEPSTPQVNSTSVEGERMEAVYFEQGSEQLSPSAQETLTRITQLLQSPEYRESRVITVVGYASSEGDLNQNENLSKSRAMVVKQRLMELGIPAGKLVILPGGQANKAAENDPNPKMNRRVEIFVGR
ncbi:hypothetical protein EBX31_00985 [bacterium]|nr:hypothetical protein [bacterium]